MASCGDKDPGGANTWYPVYIINTEQNFDLLRSNFCRDAILNYREDRQITSIQVASFTNKAKAEEFARLMQYSLGSGEVGEATVHNFTKQNDSYYPPRISKRSHNNLTIDDLADRIFYRRHPELRGRKIERHETHLKHEWYRIRNCEAIVDYVFYQRYPEFKNRKIASQPTTIVKEWLAIKRNVNGCN